MASYRSQLVLGRKPWRRNREPAWIMESWKQRRNSHHSWGSTTSSLLKTALLACRRVHTRKRKSIYKLQRWENCSNGTLGRWDIPVRVLSHSLQSVSPVDVTMDRTRQWGRGLAPPALSAHLLFFTSTLFFCFSSYKQKTEEESLRGDDEEFWLPSTTQSRLQRQMTWTK